MKYLSNQVAREIARGFEKMKFQTKWSPAHENAREGKSMVKSPRVYPYRGTEKFAVRLTHRSVMFDVAFLNSLADARRVADMALVIFWPHRVRSYTEKIPAEKFNFSEECARMDLANEHDIAVQLEKYRANLEAIGVLTPASEVIAVRAAQLKGAPKVGAALAQITESITTQLTHTRELTKGVTTAHGETLQVLTALTGNVDNIREGLGRISDPKEAIGALAARVVNVQQLFGALNETHKHEMQALQSRLAMLEGKIQSQGEWLSDFSKRNMALDAKMGTVVQLLTVVVARLNALTGSIATPLAAPAAAVQSDKLSI